MKKRVISILLIFALLSAVFTVPVTVGASSNTTSFLAARDNRWASALGLSLTQLDSLKNDIHNALKNADASVNILSYGIPYDQEDDTALDTLYEIPKSFNDIFFRSQSSATILQKGSTYTFKTLDFKYKYEKTVCAKMYSDCEKVAAQLIAGLDNSELTDIEKTLVLHDRIALWCEYDEVNYMLGVIPDISHTMYAALVNKVAVCQGYAYAYEWLLSMIGIKSNVCASDDMNHMWNVVKIGNYEYNVDITYDDPISDTYGLVLHDYFLKSYNSFQNDGVHNEKDYADFQTCATDTTYDSGYLWENSKAAFQLLNGNVYFIDNSNHTLCKYTGGNNKTVLADIGDTWRAGIDTVWPGCYSKLSSDDTYLYYNKADKVYSFDVNTNTSTEVYNPKFENYYSIFGFKAENGYFYIEKNDTPNNKNNASYLKSEINHTDADGKWESNQTQHYHTCTCGQTFDYANHTYNYDCDTTCNVCGYVRKITLLNHTNTSTINQSAATLVQKGYSGDTFCNDCQTIVANGSTLNGLATLGDIDGDTILTPADRILFSRYLANWSGVTAPTAEKGDINKDGKINQIDRIIIARFLVGWTGYSTYFN